MSAGLICDQCGETLQLNDRGESPDGEDAGWLHIRAGNLKADLCTRVCCIEWLNDPDVVADLDAYQEIITGIARTISGADGDEGEEEG